MKHLIPPAFVLLAIAILAACNSGDIFSEAPTQLVIEGMAEAGQSPVVYLTTTAPLSVEYQSKDSLASYIIRHATVRVHDGERWVYLTGKYRSSRYTFPFEYTTGQIICQAGQTYRLAIDYGDYHAEAETTIPSSPPQLDTLYAVPASQTADSLFKLRAVPHITSETQNALFFVQYRLTGGEYLFTQQDIMPSGDVELFCPYLQDFKGETEYFVSGESINIKYSKMEEHAIQFWKRYEELLTLSRNFLFPFTDNAPSNIQGGIGAWIGYNSTYQRITTP